VVCGGQSLAPSLIFYDGTFVGIDLGAGALYRCQHLEIDEPCYEGLAEALRQVVKMPLEDVESDVPSMVGALVLGERATD
jgi:hypothetical protein